MPSTATSRFSCRLRTNWVHRVRRQLTSTYTYNKNAYSEKTGSSRMSGYAASISAKPNKIVTRPLVNTCLRSLRLSNPKRMTAKLAPKLTSGMSRLAHWLVSLVMPTSVTSFMA